MALEFHILKMEKLVLKETLKIIKELENGFIMIQMVILLRNLNIDKFFTFDSL